MIQKLDSSAGFDGEPAQLVAQSFTTRRIEVLAAKVLSLATLGTGIEMFFVYLGQAHKLNPDWAWLFFTIVMLTELAFVYFAWFTRFGRQAAAAFAVVVALALCSWPVEVIGIPAATNESTPWIFEALGVAGIAASLAFSVGWAIAYIVATPLLWIMMRESTSYSRFSKWDSIEGAVYVLLFSAAVAALVVMLRRSANEADRAAHQAALAEAESARVNATELARSYIDGIVHDQVLTSLIVASQSKSDFGAASAAQLSQIAIDKLTSFSSSQVDDDVQLTVKSLFESLQELANSSPVGVEVDMGDTTDLEVPAPVAAAFSEATIQALTNSIQHAGRGVTRSLILRSTGKDIKVVIQDNGKGFSAAKVANDRLGIKLSIRNRMAAVGGKAKVDSAPNHGCKVILMWSQA